MSAAERGFQHAGSGGVLAVSVVMPVYNGSSYIAASIERVAEVMERYGLPYELIVVDDGSDDNTRREALKAVYYNMHTRVIGYKRNMGKGAAFLYGYRHSRGDIVVLLDADLDVPPQQIRLLLEAI